MANSIGTPLTADDVLKALADLDWGIAQSLDKLLRDRRIIADKQLSVRLWEAINLCLFI